MWLIRPKSFKKDKFSKTSPPKADKDCRLGVQTASNQHNEKKYEFYWGYKNHILVDCISGLPVCELTTGANVSDSSVTLKTPKSCRQEISSVKPDRQCVKTADFQKTVVRVRNTAVRLSVLKAVVALAITNVGITARKTAVAQNT